MQDDAADTGMYAYEIFNDAIGETHTSALARYHAIANLAGCLLYTSPSPRDRS